MSRALNLILLIGLNLLYIQTHSKEIYQSREYTSSEVSELSVEMNSFNTNLNLLSITLLNLIPKKDIDNK